MNEWKKGLFFLLVTGFLLFAAIGVLKAETIDSPYLTWLQDRCAIHNVPMEIALAVAIVESNFEMVNSDPNKNGSIDIGIFQLNSNFIEWFEEALWYDEQNFNANDPHDNIEMGIIYLKHLYKQTRTWDLAVRAYNTGLHALAYDPDRSWNYFVKVVNVLNTLEIRINK